MSMSEIPVTNEMIEARFLVLSISGIADDYLGADRLLVADIYRAMFACCSRACPESSAQGDSEKTSPIQDR